MLQHFFRQLYVALRRPSLRRHLEAVIYRIYPYVRTYVVVSTLAIVRTPAADHIPAIVRTLAVRRIYARNRTGFQIEQALKMSNL